MVAALVAMVAGLAFTLNQQWDAAEAPHTPDVTRAGPSQSTAPTDAAPAASEGPSTLDRCRGQYDAQGPVLRGAARSIKQWEVHVDAMNQLVAGEITLAQASAFWDRTRIGAKGRVAAFRESDEAYADERHDCPPPPAAEAASLRQCARSVALRDEVVATARRSIDTWAMHVRDMERLRNGQLSPARAAEMWRMSWHMGQHQIDAYRDALRRAHHADECLG